MFSIEKSVLVLIDLQEKLFQVMQEKENLLRNIQILVQTCQHLQIPIIYTEQVPTKLGSTVFEIQSFLGSPSPIEKSSFSCFARKTFRNSLKDTHRHQVILAGIETHVCVYQTVSDLINQKYEVQVVADAVSSRCNQNKNIALDRMKSMGGVLTSTEMILFEWLKTAEHEKFHEILKLIKCIGNSKIF